MPRAMVERVQERETILQEIQTAGRHMAVYGVGNLLVKALGFLMLPFYTHYLNPRDYGILEILDLSMTLFGLVLNMGMAPAFLRCYAAVESQEEKRRLASTGCIFGFVTGGLTFLAGVGAVRPSAHLLFGSGVPAAYLLISFGAVVLNYAATIPRTYLRAIEASGAYVTADTVGIFVLLFLNILFIAVWKLGVMGVLLSSLIVAAVQVVGFGVWVIGKTGVGFFAPYLGRMLRFGGPLIFANMGLFVLNFSDRFFLQRLRSLDAVGVYAVGYKFGFMMNYLVVQPFFVMWQSRMYAIHGQPEHRKVFRQIFSLYSLWLISVGLVMSLFSSEAVRLMVEPKFAASQEVIPIVVLSYIFYGLSYYAQLGLLLTDRTKQVAVIGAGVAAANLVLNYFLISYFGMLGAAWATAISFALLALASYVWSRRVFPLALGLPRMWATMLTAIVTYLLGRQVTPLTPLASVPLKCLLLAAFGAFLWKTGIIDPASADVLKTAGNKVAGKLSRVWPWGVGRRITEIQ